VRQTSLEPDPTPTLRAAAVGRAPVAVTGIQASGRAHLGNFLGLIRPALALAASHDALYVIADAHALTTLRDGAAQRRHTREIAATWLALGLDPHRTTLYRQSDLPEVFELAWILACFTGKGLLNRAHAYKAAVAANRATGRADDHGVTGGTFGYPVLMAADVLLLAADAVPVGLDQKQHVEIAREIGASFNAVHGPVLTLPEPLIDRRVATIPGLDGRKMSKSYGNVVPIFAEPDELRRLVGRIVTDSRPAAAPKDPERCNLFALYRHLAQPATVAALHARYLEGGVGLWRGQGGAGRAAGCGAFGPARVAYRALMADPAELERLLAAGAERVRGRATPVIDRVRAAVGLGQPPAGTPDDRLAQVS
jgi:tryptophanyl-tRNA synthetase